jgi:cytochrome c5
MAAYCAACHGEGKKGAPKLELESYEFMKDFVGTAIGRIQDGSMPPSGYPALPPEPLQILLDWSESKAP